MKKGRAVVKETDWKKEKKEIGERRKRMRRKENCVCLLVCMRALALQKTSHCDEAD